MPKYCNRIFTKWWSLILCLARPVKVTSQRVVTVNILVTLTFWQQRIQIQGRESTLEMGSKLTLALNQRPSITSGWMDKYRSALRSHCIICIQPAVDVRGREGLSELRRGTETSDWETDAYLMAEKARAQEQDREWADALLIELRTPRR